MANISPQDLAYSQQYIGLPWKRLEIEEQAHARKLMREGYIRIEGNGADRRVVLVTRAIS